MMGDASSNGLPPSVHLLTLQQWTHSSLLVRLAHVYQAGEGAAANLSQPTTIDLGSLVPHQVKAVSELSLTANECRDARPRLRFEAGAPIGNGSVGTMGGGRAPALGCGVRVRGGRELLVEMGPMDIRTFELMLVLHRV